MGRRYKHLDLEERCRICALRSLGHSLDEIAVKLGRSNSTICRELKRNCDWYYRKHCELLLPLQDRKTRYWMMSKLPRKDADTTAEMIRFRLEGLPEKAVRPLLLRMAASSRVIRGWSRKQDCALSSVIHIPPGNADRLKTEIAASGEICREKQTFRTGPTMTSKHSHSS